MSVSLLLPYRSKPLWNVNREMRVIVQIKTLLECKQGDESYRASTHAVNFRDPKFVHIFNDLIVRISTDYLQPLV